jgi:hypothetical protein
MSDKEDKKFYKQASKMIYKWLPPDKKIKLNFELIGEGKSGIRDMEDEERFFRLMNFLEVNYVRVKDWVDETAKRLQKLNEMLGDNQIKDIEIELFGNKKVKLLEVRRELSDTQLQNEFFSTLKNLKLENDYRYHFYKIGGEQSE